MSLQAGLTLLLSQFWQGRARRTARSRLLAPGRRGGPGATRTRPLPLSDAQAGALRRLEPTLLSGKLLYGADPESSSLQLSEHRDGESPHSLNLDPEGPLRPALAELVRTQTSAPLPTLDLERLGGDYHPLESLPADPSLRLPERPLMVGLAEPEALAAGPLERRDVSRVETRGREELEAIPSANRVPVMRIKPAPDVRYLGFRDLSPQQVEQLQRAA